MSYFQTLNPRNDSTGLSIFDTNTTGDLTIAKSATRTADLIIGNAGQTTTETTIDGGKISITGRGAGANGDVVIEAAGTGTTFLGATTANTLTRVANVATTMGIIIGSAQTSGTLVIGGSTSRTGTIDMGSGSSTHLTRIRGADFTADVSGAAILDGGTTVDVLAGSGKLTVASAAADVDIDAGTTLGLGSVGAMTIASSAGALDVDAFTTLDMTSVGEMNISNTGTGAALVVEAAGTSGRSYFGATNVVDNETFIADGATTGNVIIGRLQTTGDINVGTGASRTTGCNIGVGAKVSGTTNFFYCGTCDQDSVDATTVVAGTTMGVTGGTGTTVTATTGALALDATAAAVTVTAGSTVGVTGATGVDVTATTGDIDLVSSNATGDVNITAGSAGDCRITSGADMVVTSANGDVHVETSDATKTTFLGSNSVQGITRLCNGATTAALVVGSNQTSGAITIAGKSARTGSVSFGAGDGDYLFNARSGSMNLQTVQASDGDMTIISAKDLTVTAVGALDIAGVDMRAPDSASFVPTIGDGTNAFTQSGATGSYWRWGNMVQVAIGLNWTDKGSASGDVRIGNLPFAFPALPSGTPAPRVYGILNKSSPFTPTGGAVIEVASSTGQTYMNVYEDGAILDDGDCSATGTVEISIVYMLA